MLCTTMATLSLVKQWYSVDISALLLLGDNGDRDNEARRLWWQIWRVEKMTAQQCTL